MEISFRRVKHEIWQPNHSQEWRSLEKIVMASGENLDENRVFTIPARETIVACMNGSDVGFVATDYSQNCKYKEIAIFVDSKYQKLGIGSTLFKKIYATIGEFGIFTNVGETQKDALKFLENLGFQRVYDFYSTDILFDRMKYLVTSWFSNNQVDEVINVEQCQLEDDNPDDQIKSFINEYHRSILSNFDTDVVNLIGQEIVKRKGIFDCTEVYLARDSKNAIVGIISFSVWTGCPILEFFHVENSNRSFLISMFLMRIFLSSRYRQHTSEVNISAYSLNTQSVHLLQFLNDELPNGRVVYARPYKNG